MISHPKPSVGEAKMPNEQLETEETGPKAPDLGQNPEPQPPDDKGNGKHSTEGLYREIARQEAELLDFKRRDKERTDEIDKYRGIEARLKKEGPALLAEYGWDMDTISQRVLNDNVPGVEEEVKRIRDEIKALTDQKESEELERKKTDRQRFLSDYAKDFRSHVDQSETHEPLRSLLDLMSVVLGKEPDLAAEFAPVLDGQYDRDQTIIQPAKMADYMLEQAKTRLDTIKAHDALKKMFGAAPEEEASVESPTPPQRSPDMSPMTLSNDVDTQHGNPVQSAKLQHAERLKILEERLKALGQEE